METIKLNGQYYISVQQAAELAGVKKVTVYKTIERGRLDSTRLLDKLIVVPVRAVLKRWPNVEGSNGRTATD